ncbi:MAG: hypothetical protein MZW92_40605 [Comamonadaceae bacterium]|nr:hypothetical protein [Comamonadaceae bacterium]
MILGTAAYMAPEQARGKAGRQARRHLGVRRRPLRDAHGPAALPRRGGLGHAGRRASAGRRLADALARRSPPAAGGRLLAALPRERDPQPAAAAISATRGCARRRMRGAAAPAGHGVRRPGRGRGASSAPAASAGLPLCAGSSPRPAAGSPPPGAVAGLGRAPSAHPA